MFMAVISNWLEMGSALSRASTAEATASEAPFSSAETEAAGSEALGLAAPEEAADNLRVKNMMDGIEMSISAENEEAYRSMILKAVQKQTEEQSTGMSQQM